MSDFYTDGMMPPILDFQIMNKAVDSRDPEELERLSHSADEHVRARVAENAYTPVEVLQRLAMDSTFVRLYLIRNRSLPYHMLRQYINVGDDEFKKRVYNRLLEGYRDGAVDLTGEEIYLIMCFLEPEMDMLTKIEIIEEFHQRYDKAKRR